MNQEIIVDTSALIAFFVKSETNHQLAKQYTYHNLNHRWIILETVFDETVTINLTHYDLHHCIKRLWYYMMNQIHHHLIYHGYFNCNPHSDNFYTPGIASNFLTSR